MAAPNTINVIKGPARLILTPTDLSTTAPYGGTYLGLARGLEFRWGSRGHTERAIEWGNVPNRRLWTGEWAMLVAVLRTWDADLLGNVFPTYAAGSGSGKATTSWDVNGSVRAGKFMSGAKILIAPLINPTSQPAALLYAGLPRAEDAATLSFSRRREAGIGVVWEAAPDANGRMYQTGMLEDLSL